jgi:hypothetical protein
MNKSVKKNKPRVSKKGKKKHANVHKYSGTKETEEIYKKLKTKLSESGYLPELYEYIRYFFDKTITHHAYKNKELQKKIIAFSKTYPVIPLNNEIAFRLGNELVNSRPVFRKGKYGSIFESKFDGEAVITKTMRTTDDFYPDMYASEIIINLLLNAFLLDNELLNNLVPTYGIFICRQENSTQVCVSHDYDPITGTDNEDILTQEYYINMTQKKITGQDLKTFISRQDITVKQVQDILIKLFTALTYLNQSSFKIRHNDLHYENILIQVKSGIFEPVLLDFGMATYNFQKDGEDIMIRALDANHEVEYDDTIVTGSAIDAWALFRSMSYSPNESIRDYANQVTNLLFFNKTFKCATGWLTSDYKSPNGEGIDDGDNIWFYFFMKQLDDDVDSVDADISERRALRKDIHDFNVKKIKDYTYSYILEIIRSFDYKPSKQKNPFVQRAVPMITNRCDTPKQIKTIPNSLSLLEIKQLIPKHSVINPSLSKYELCKALNNEIPDFEWFDKGIKQPKQ